MALRPPTLFPLFLLTTACTGSPGAAADPVAADVDGDGLDASYEEQVGTSDASADTDQDGCSDVVEVLGYFDPLEPTDRPYTGGYPRGPRPKDAVFDALAEEHGEGFEVGMLNPNWTLTDQHGEEIELRDFYGQVVMVDLASEWCDPCIDAAPILDAFYNDNKERGFVVLQIILEGAVNNSEPKPQRWIEATGVTFPVLADHSPGDYTQTEVAQYYLDVEGLEYSMPNFTLLDRELRITHLYVLGDLSEDLDADIALFESALEEPVPAVEPLLPANADALREELGMDPDSQVIPASLCGGAQ